MPATATDPATIQAHDVVRSTRMGNKTIGNYVIDRLITPQPDSGHYWFAYAHSEHGAGKPSFMGFPRNALRVIRSYR
jgi:hypothetical protein